MMSDIEKNELSFIHDTKNWKFGTVDNCTEFKNRKALSSITSILNRYIPEIPNCDVENIAITVMNEVVHELHRQNKTQSPFLVDPLVFKDLMIESIFSICGVKTAKEYILAHCDSAELNNF